MATGGDVPMHAGKKGGDGVRSESDERNGPKNHIIFNGTKKLLETKILRDDKCDRACVRTNERGREGTEPLRVEMTKHGGAWADIGLQYRV